jgi:two-component system chemotaxis response regulator CheB
MVMMIHKYVKARTMENHDIIVVGASYGGVQALSEMVFFFPENLPAAVFVVQHIPKNRSALDQILSWKGPLTAVHPKDGAMISPGTITIAPPNQHLLVGNPML